MLIQANFLLEHSLQNAVRDVNDDTLKTVTFVMPIVT